MPLHIEKREAKKAKSGYTYRFIATYTDNYGTRQTKKKGGFKTKKEAQIAGEDFLHEIKKGIMPDASKKTLDDVWNDYLELEANKITEGSLYNYKNVYKNYIQPELGQRPVRSLDYKILQSLINNVPPTRAGMVKIVLNILFKMAVRLGYIPFSPTHEVRVPKVKEPEKVKKLDADYILPDRFYDLLDKVSWNRAYTRMFWLGWFLGLRIGEAMALDWEAVDFENHSVFIHQQMLVNNTITQRLKTKASRAHLPIADPLYKMLLEWKAEDDKMSCPYLIYNKKRQRSKRSTANTYFNGMDHFHYHQLRHTYITNLANSTRSIKTVSALARHDNISTTLQFYTEVTDEMKEEAISKAFPNLPQKDKK